MNKIVFLVCILAVLGSLNGVNAAWYNDAYKGKVQINFSVSTGQTEGNSTVFLRLNSDIAPNAFNWNNNLSDILFTNSSETIRIPHWVENYSFSDQDAWIWIKVDQPITANNYSVYMYYNNNESDDSTNVSNIYDVGLFGDDFHESDFTSRWQYYVDTGTCDQEVDDGYLRFYGCPGTDTLNSKTNIPIGNGIVLESRFNSSDFGISGQFLNVLWNISKARIRMGRIVDDFYIDTQDNFGTKSLNVWGAAANNDFVRMKGEINSTKLYNHSFGPDYFNVSNISQIELDVNANTISHFNVSLVNANDGEIWLDFIFVRKYLKEMPLGILGDSFVFGNITNCTNSDNVVYSFDFMNEQTLKNIKGDMDILIEPVNADDTDISNISFNFSGSDRYEICLDPSNTEIQVDVTILYNNDSYTQRTYYIENNTINSEAPQNITLYLVNDSIDSLIEVNILDSINFPIEDALISIIRQYVGDNSFKTVQIGKSDFEGKSVINLITNTVLYKFLVVKDGVILFNSNPTFITSTSLTLQTGASDIGESYTLLNNTAAYCSFNDVTFDLTCNALDLKGNTQTFCLDVEERVAFGNSSICHECQTGPSVTFVCNTGNTTNRYITYDVYVQGSVFNILRGALQYIEENQYGVYGLFFSLFIIVSLAFLGNSPSLVIIRTMAALILLVSFGFINILWGALSSVLFIGSIIVYLLRK